MSDNGELALYRAIVASMTDGVAVIGDADNVVVWANDRLATILGEGTGDLRGRTASELSIKDCAASISTFDHPDYGTVSLAIVSTASAEAAAAAGAVAGTAPAQDRGAVMRGTTLPGRGTFQDDLTREMSRVKRSGASLSVAMLSLDGKLDFSDPETIDVLAHATVAWRGALRDSDTISYYEFGEFEYVVLLPECPWPEAEMVAERARSATPGPRTCSAGFATWSNGELGLQMVARAHRALREARSSGGDKSVGSASAAV